MRIASLEKRVRVLELALPGLRNQCLCRAGDQTMYHNARELGMIMEVPCPAHGVRDLGRLRWLPSALPLRADDLNVCSCPPTPVREFLQGGRGPLTQAELQEAENSWEKEYGPGSAEAWRLERSSINDLLRQYKNVKRKGREKNG